MTSDLLSKTCVPCKGGVAPLSLDEAEALLLDISGWELKEGVHHLLKRFTFPDFAEALKFVNLVGKLAESEGHHPDIEFGWGYVQIAIFTHKIKGLHDNDFILAAKIDAL